MDNRRRSRIEADEDNSNGETDQKSLKTNIADIKQLLPLVFSHSSPQKPSQVATVCKLFSDHINHPLAWEKRYKQHFGNPRLEPIDWQTAFTAEQNRRYEALTPRLRQLFYYVNENKITELRLEKVTLEDLWTFDKSKNSLLRRAMEHGYYETLQYFYHVALGHFSGYSNDNDMHYYQTDRNGHTLLHWAAMCMQDPIIITHLVDKGYDVNAVNMIGLTALHSGMNKNSELTVQTLVNLGANVNAQDTAGYTALFFAAQEGLSQIVKLLLATNKIGPSLLPTNAFGELLETPLATAAQNGHEYCVNLLAAYPQTINAGPNNKSPLYMAAANGRVGCVEILLNRGANPNLAIDPYSDTPLMIASRKGHTDIVRLLCAHGAKTTLVDSSGRTALYIAIKQAKIGCMQQLLDFGGKIDQSLDKSGATALMLSCATPCTDMTIELLERHANVNLALTDGKSPLHFAVQSNNIEAVRLLLHANADIDAKMKIDKATLRKFQRTDHTEIQSRMTTNLDALPEIDGLVYLTPQELASFLCHEELKEILETHRSIIKCRLSP